MPASRKSTGRRQRKKSGSVAAAAGDPSASEVPVLQPKFTRKIPIS